MRVALLCLDRGVPLGGAKGCSVHLRSVAAALLRAGHEVEALVVEPGPEPESEPLLASGLRVRHLDGAPGASAPAPGPGPLPGAAEIARHLEAVGPDLVIERLALLAPVGAEAASRLGVPHVYEINAPLENEAADHRGFTDLGAARAGFRAGFARSSGAIAVSEEVARWARTLAPAGYEVQVVPNGADPIFFETPGSDAVDRMRRALGFVQPAFNVGFVGSFKPWHDLENLVRAVAGLGVRTPSRLVAVGDGPRRSAVLAAAFSSGVQVAHLPHVPHEDVPAVFALCDAVAVPYASEEAYFSPLKLAEAMSAGRPVVASATGPCMRVIRHGEDGLLVPPGDSVAMTAALRRLALDPDLRERLGGAARRSASRLFNWDRAVARMLALAGRHLSATRGG